MRWQKGHVVWDAAGQERKIWQLIRGKRPQQRREVYDARMHTTRLMGINVLSLRHPGYAAPVWLGVARPGGGKEPWSLVTNTPLTCVDEGWRMIAGLCATMANRTGVSPQHRSIVFAGPLAVCGKIMTLASFWSFPKVRDDSCH